MGIKIGDYVAECVGLWLAEGSQNSKLEITFTNNCLELIELFSNTVDVLFKGLKYNKRIYVYTPDGSKPQLSFKDCQINYYIHKRATKPYFIFRIASVKIVNEWKKIVNNFLEKEAFYPLILRGFFAGEGNIHEGKKSVRLIRISQKERKFFIENMLGCLKITYNFTSSNRMYNISNKRNWDIFAKYNLADLHPNKKKKFWRLYRGYKEEHYDKFYLRNRILELVEKPITPRKLVKELKRSRARISEVLVALKKEGKVNNYRVGSVDYWTNKQDHIIISIVKKRYLSFLDKPRRTSEFAKYFKVNWQSSLKRLDELQSLNLAIRGENGKWTKTPTQKKIVVI